MKKYVIAALALCFAGSAMALDNEPKSELTWQGVLGMNVSSVSGTRFHGTVGGTAGVRGEYFLPKMHGAFVNFGLNWSMKGGRYSFAEGSDVCTETDPALNGAHEGTQSLSTHSLELPIHVGFRYNINKSLGVYGDVGPYFAVALAGGNKHRINTDGHRAETRSYGAFRKSDGFGRFDCGVGFRVGAEYDNHYSLNLGFDWGVTDIYYDSNRDAWAKFMKTRGTDGKAFPAWVKVNDSGALNKAKNFCFSLAFAYRF